MTIDEFRARDLDITKPTAARLYDYYLGGTAHYAVDKVFAERMFKICPYLDTAAHHNRGFLQRASRYISAECGVRQFLDIGAGIPTVGNTHHVVRETYSDAPVVYVDNDIEAVNQSYDLLAREDAKNVVIIEADLRNPETILDHPDTQRLIDFDEPVGLLIVSVWPLISDDDRPYELMATYRDRLASGSYVAMSHGSVTEASEEARAMFSAVARAYDETRDPVTQRDRDGFARFFDGFVIEEPGIVYCPDWYPLEPVDFDDPIRPCNFAAVGRKP